MHNYNTYTHTYTHTNTLNLITHSIHSSPKIDSTAVLAAAFKHRLNDYLRMTVCTEVDLQGLSPESHKVSLGFFAE